MGQDKIDCCLCQNSKHREQRTHVDSQLMGLEEELPFLLANELPRTQVFNEQQADGSNRIEIFLARKGYKL